MSSGIPILIVVVVIVLVYAWGWYRLRNALPNVLSVWRLAAFTSGVFSLWAAVGSPLAVLDHQFLTAHMVQHLLLMTVAAPLILLGAPAMMLRGFPQRCILGVLVSCWLASTCTVIGWHIPALFAIGMRSERWHTAEDVSFFVAGLLFWWPITRLGQRLEQGPGWSVPLYLFLATLPCDALSAFLTFCNRVVYPHYLSAYRPLGISALGDQQCAGALMWVWSTFAYLAPAAVVTIQMLSPKNLEQPHPRLFSSLP